MENGGMENGEVKMENDWFLLLFVVTRFSESVFK
jgi:hypothetical protein